MANVKKKALILFILIMTVFTFILSGCSTKKDISSESNKAQTVENKDSQASAQNTTDSSSDNELGGLISSDIKDPDNYSVEYVYSSEGLDDVVLKVWVNGKKEKIESGEGDQTIIAYIDHDKGIQYTYMKSLNSAVKSSASTDSSFQSPANFMGTLDKEQLKYYKKIGEEIVDGNKCTKYEYKLSTNNEDFVIYLMEKTGYILKYVYLKDNKTATSVYFRSFKIGGVTDEMVTIPKNIPVTE